VALARVFLAAGDDLALETVYEPEAFTQRWRPLLAGLAWHLVVLRPSLPVTLARSRARAKRVLEEHTIAQHERTGGWSADLQIDTTDLSVGRNLETINNPLGLLDPDPAGQRSPQLAHLDLVVGQLDRRVDQLSGHDRERPQRRDLRG
jgi:hypothetical protein